ncbi:hypothetical protein BDW02DRAFT_238432 [Decorospora gaudefroyi]|uniref:Uncharacterized protein n=1 Tax=Decorospora gaudefroyi TaxID=184978 RepID=A0A6A5KMJ6_9PLEO|nr:hypothetical protein BDW02DRAFT_238432 [Decorospora gaudefroyi]
MFTFASGKQVWYLALVLSAIAFLLYSSVSFWFGGPNFSHSERYPKSLTTIFSAPTIDALNQDLRLRGALLSLTESIALSSTDLGERFRLHSLKSFGSNISNAAKHVRQSELRRRGIMDDISQGVGNLTGAGSLNSTNGMNGLISSLRDSIAGSLDTPALFLGIGLGMGATTALNLSDIQEASAVATRVASAYNSSATGVNLAAQNLGYGLGGQISPSLQNTNVSLGLATYALGSGIGNGTALGLGLTQEQFAPSDGMSIENLAGNFGLGLAMPIASNLNIQSMMKSLGNILGASTLMDQIPEIAAAAGMGLGKGARDGLGLRASDQTSTRMLKRQPLNDTTDMGNIPEAVESFSKGLSQSFVQGSNLTTILCTVGTVFPDTLNFQGMLRPLAVGAGAGIGMGVAIGLNLKSADAVPTLVGNTTGDEEQTALAAESFTQNLFSNLLMNSTAIQQAQEFIMANTPQAFKDVDGAKAAEGFARGTIEGVMSAMSSVGGIKNLISGNVPFDAFDNVPVLPSTQFNDSMDGFAVGFARGLTGKATLLVAEIARNLTNNSTVSEPMQKRSVGHGIQQVGVVAYNAISARQAQENGASQIPIAIDAGTAQVAAQKVLDTLTCQGIGGIASVAFGAMAASQAEASMMDMAMSVPLESTVLQALPRGPITLSSEGNMFEIVIQSQSLKVNGLALMPFAVLTGLHVLFSVLAFLIFLPLYLVLGVVSRFSVLVGFPINESKNKKWRMGFLLVFAIFGIAGIVLGIIGMGSASHFRDTHGIIGLVCLILLLPAVCISIVRQRTDVPHPSSSAFAGIKGPIALAKTPQRIYLISGILTQLLLGLGQFAVLQGFSTLRAISLCIVDAILTSASTAGLLSFLLMLQISATALIGIRAWLEQHVAKKEAAGVERIMTSEEREKDRVDTMGTFGFDAKDPPPARNLAVSKPRLIQRKTDELKGFEDVGISTPFNVRKEGSISSPGASPAPRQGPFLSPEERVNYQERGIYNPKTGGYTYNPAMYGTYQRASDYEQPSSDPYDERRPSSDLFDPLSSPRPPMIAQAPKQTNVSTQDLWPPPPPQMYMTPNAVSNNYSRPNPGPAPVRDSFMGFGEDTGLQRGLGRGPGGTIREKR